MSKRVSERVSKHADVASPTAHTYTQTHTHPRTSPPHRQSLKTFFRYATAKKRETKLNNETHLPAV